MRWKRSKTSGPPQSGQIGPSSTNRLNGKLDKSFEADALHKELGFVLEVEAGRGVTNNQFLKDLFQACMMSNT